MAAGQAEGFESVGFDPAQHGAFADLAVGGDVLGGESDVTSIVSFHQLMIPQTHMYLAMSWLFSVFLTM